MGNYQTAVSRFSEGLLRRSPAPEDGLDLADDDLLGECCGEVGFELVATSPGIPDSSGRV
jgi:hypothetical protein